MQFFLRKLAEAALTPLGLSAILVLAGLALRRRLVALVGVAVLLAFSMPATSRWITQSLERVYPPAQIAAAQPADAIVVLSGSVVRAIAPPGVQWGESASRFFTGFDLATAGKAKMIVFTAGAADDPGGPTQGAILRQSAIDHGIQPERILLTPFVTTTADEARAVSQMPGIHSILLVTSAFHMPRAVLLFRARGLDVSPFPTDERVFGKPGFHATSFVPLASALYLSDEAVREYYGLAVYRLLYMFQPLGRLKR
jgi:uncharacterized SAM-binding protein YcdF (DUF218 family)